MTGMALKTTNLMRIALYAMRAHAASQRVRFAFMPTPLNKTPGILRLRIHIIFPQSA